MLITSEPQRGQLKLKNGSQFRVSKPGSNPVVIASGNNGLRQEHLTDPDFGARVPPYNLEAEQALLGAMLHNNDVLERIRYRLGPNDFYDELHRVIFEYGLKLIDDG